MRSYLKTLGLMSAMAITAQPVFDTPHIGTKGIYMRRKSDLTAPQKRERLRAKRARAARRINRK